MDITFFVPGLPIAQPRQRHAVRQFGGKAVAVNYTPKTSPVATFKAAVQWAAKESHSGAPLTGPLRVSLTFYFPPTAKEAKQIDRSRQPHTKRGDIDNLTKAVLDALNGWWLTDDSQVAILRAEKWIAGAYDVVGTEVTVASIQPPTNRST